jgi:hypothetical protein
VRALALALSFVMVGGNAALCAGWAATPEARMACCSESGECPMHAGDEHGAAPEGGLTQEQADACCAASEHDQSSQPAPAVPAVISSAVLGGGVIVPARTPAFVLSNGWRTDAPIPIASVPRHVLLSVFLI